MLSNALASSDTVWNRIGIATLLRVGGKASAFAPSLLDLAKRTSHDYVRTEALPAAGAVQPSLAETMSDVAQVLASDASTLDLSAKLNAGNASPDELVATLRLPR